MIIPEDETHFEMEILTYFSSTDCFVLPPPSNDENVVNDVVKYHNRLYQNFLNGVNKLLSTYLGKNMPLKKVYHYANPIDGQILVLLTKQYIEALNTCTASPETEISIHLDVSQIRIILNEFVDLYHNQMQKEFSTTQEDMQLALEIEADNNTPSLMQLHRLIFCELSKKLLHKLRPLSLLTNKKQVVNNYHKLLVQYEGEEVTGGVLYEFLVKNVQLSQAFCEEKLFFHYQLIEQKLSLEDNSYNYKQYVDDLMTVKDHYVASAKGPAKWNVLFKGISDLRCANLPGFEDKFYENLKKLIHLYSDEERHHFKKIKRKENAKLKENLIQIMQEEMQCQIMLEESDELCLQEKKNQEEIIKAMRQTRKRKMSNEAAREFKKIKKREDICMKGLENLEEQFKLFKHKLQTMTEDEIAQFSEEQQKKEEEQDQAIQQLKLEILQNRKHLYLFFSAYQFMVNSMEHSFGQLNFSVESP